MLIDLGVLRLFVQTKGQPLDFDEVLCSEPPPQGAVVVVDPFSTRALVAAGVVTRGMRLIVVFSDAATVAAVGDITHLQGGGHDSDSDRPDTIVSP